MNKENQQDGKFSTSEQKLNDSNAKKFKKYNRRIIIMNFLFLLIALISIWSLMFIPFAKLDIQLDKQSIAKAVDSVPNDKFESAIGKYITKSDIKAVTENISVEFGVMNLKSIDFLKIGIDKNLTKTKQILAKYIQKNLTKPVETLVQQASSSVLALSTKLAIAFVAENVNIDPEQLQSIVGDVQSALDILQNSDGKDNATVANEAADTIIKGSAFQAIMSSINTSGTNISEDDIKNNLSSALEVILDNGKTEDGKFSMNAVIGNLDKVIQDIQQNLNQKPSTTFATTSANNNNANDMMNELIQNIENPEKIIDNFISKLTTKQKEFLSYGIFTFGLLTCISAIVWALLTISILLHFLFKKKAVSLWAVIWLGGLQAIWMLPLFAISFLKLTAILQYVSFTWISFMASLITMILYFIFYRKPKKMIKKLAKKSGI